jgi:hypothetical protein
MNKVFEHFPSVTFNYYSTKTWPDKYSNIKNFNLEELK